MGKMFGYGEIKLFSGSASQELAQAIGDYLGLPLESYDLIQFPNENLFVRLHGSVRGQDVYIVQSMNPPVHRNIMELLITVDCLKRDSAGRITAVFPYMAYARSDKKDQPRVPITARLVADMIEVAGTDRYMTIDLHAGQIQGFFSIPGDVLTAFHILSDYFLEKKLEDVVVATADLGFAKKGRNFAAKLGVPLAFVEKRRRVENLRARATTVIGDVTGKDVILVDDEVLTGGSMSEAIQIVKDHGARDIYLSFTHPLLVQSATEELAKLPIKEIVTTNTVIIPPDKRLPNMTILSVAPLLGEVILRAHEGRSVGELFNE
ncbi:MAG: ribose-phosphate pyrophosphokinase [Anaerolineales bacterium]|nr:MAG: ribose-phosphate pyrophosphokinase [Anaerolineales bacterium]